jgi:hypothetical protein
MLRTLLTLTVIFVLMGCGHHHHPTSREDGVRAQLGLKVGSVRGNNTELNLPANIVQRLKMALRFLRQG